MGPPPSLSMVQPIHLGPAQASGLPRTWKPPCPWGEHHLKALERRNGSDDAPTAEEAEERAQAEKMICAVESAARDDELGSLTTALEACYVDARDADGATALIHASRHGHVKAVQLLLSANAEVRLCTSALSRPLDLCSLSLTLTASLPPSLPPLTTLLLPSTNRSI